MTNLVKLLEGMYQAGAKADVLSSEKLNVVEADTFILVEGSMRISVMAS
jgi:hypothetical protein